MQNDMIAIVSDRITFKEIPINCSTQNLVYISLLKAKTSNSTATTYLVICIFNESIKGGINLRITRNQLTVVENQSKSMLESTRKSKTKCKNDSNDWRLDPLKMRRMQFLLEQYKEQFTHRQQVQMMQIRELINKIKIKMEEKPTTADDLENQKIVSAQRIKVEDQSVVRSIVLNDFDIVENLPTPANRLTIPEAIEKLKEIKTSIEASRRLRKRAAVEDLQSENIIIRDLIVNNQYGFRGTHVMYSFSM